ncbi:hypothetical protein [Reyranella sp.]|uniref:hypothetical protein n=1 Tax=Reyranella sp. TaxID=1929291 RepID=UPI003BABAD11
MIRSVTLATLAATAALAAIPLVASQPANAQVSVQIGTAPPPAPRNGAWGDRDRDGIPNQLDRYSNNNRSDRRALGDQDHDGVPNRHDTDKDGDGVPNRWDRNDNNPHRR